MIIKKLKQLIHKTMPNNEKWTQKDLITDITDSTEVLILNGNPLDNKRIKFSDFIKTFDISRLIDNPEFNNNVNVISKDSNTTIYLTIKDSGDNAILHLLSDPNSEECKIFSTAGKLIIESPTLTGNITIPTVLSTDNSSKPATTKFVQSQKNNPTFTGNVIVPEGIVTGAAVNKNQLDRKADLRFPVFKNNVVIEHNTDPNDPNGEVIFEVRNSHIGGDTDVSINDFGYLYLRKGIFFGENAKIESPTFTGIATAPTATIGTNTKQIATTEFVLANSSKDTFKTFVINASNIDTTFTNGYYQVIGILPNVLTAAGWVGNETNFVYILHVAGDYNNHTTIQTIYVSNTENDDVALVKRHMIAGSTFWKPWKTLNKFNDLYSKNLNIDTTDYDGNALQIGGNINGKNVSISTEGVIYGEGIVVNKISMPYRDLSEIDSMTDSTDMGTYRLLIPNTDPLYTLINEYETILHVKKNSVNNSNDFATQVIEKANGDEYSRNYSTGTWSNWTNISKATKTYVDEINSNLNGTNYIMVYAIGTPEENAAELQAAYDAARNMPRYLGALGAAFEGTLYVGQTFLDDDLGGYNLVNTTQIVVGGTGTGHTTITEAQAKSTRTTVIVAPGKYTFTTPLAVDTEYIDIVSLTGNADVLLNGINVTANNVYLKGINCGENTFSLWDNFPLIKLEKCIGGNESFGTYFSGIAMNCTGGAESFGFTGDMTGQLQYCKLISGTYPIVSGSGHIVWCINADGSAATNQ